jgi:pilus assembly protein CpaB
MKSRGMVGVIAFVLATVATAAVFLYVHGVKQKAESSGAQVQVIVSDRDIPTGTILDTLIDEGAFVAQTIPKSSMVEGAVTTLEQLKGKRTSAPVLAGEQIPLARIQGGVGLPGGALGIPGGFEAMTVQLESQRIVGGTLHPGDHVSILGSFAPPIAQNITVTLVPDVKVLRVSRPAATDQSSDGMLITLALKAQDGERVVFGQEHGTVWMALVPPGESGQKRPPVTIGGVLK